MKVLLTSVSAGAGHIRAAEAVERALRVSHPGVQVSHINVMDYVTPPFRKIYEGGYSFLANKLPGFWGLLYKTSDHNPLHRLTDPVMNFIQRINSDQFFRHVAHFAPDVVVSTHFLVPQIFRGYTELECVITDYVEHSFWLDPSVRRYYVAHEGIRQNLVLRDIPAEKIVVSGIPIDPIFSKEVNVAALQIQLKLKTDVPVVLALSGGWGFGSMDKTLQALFSLQLPVQILAVAGRNEALRKKVAALNPPSHISLTTFGHVNNMHELLSISDLVIGKAGGLTVSEGLAKGVGMIFYGVLPGQEEKNAEYVEKKGAGKLVLTLDELVQVVESTLKNPTLLKKMKENSLTAARPRAAFTIADSIAHS